MKFEWGDKEQTAFDDLKKRLTSAAVLAHPDSVSPVRRLDRRLGLCYFWSADAGPS